MAGEWRNFSAQEPTAALHGVRPSSSFIHPLLPGHSFPKYSPASLFAQPIMGDVDREKTSLAWPSLATDPLGQDRPPQPAPLVRPNSGGKPGLRTQRQPKKKVWAKGYI